MKDESKFLIDTNIFLNIIAKTEKSDECKTFLERIHASRLFVSDFVIHSLGIILFSFNQHDEFISLLKEILFNNLNIISIIVDELPEVKKNSLEFSLDFDDAYQYTLARENDLCIVTFDVDFKDTDICCYEPQEVLKTTDF